MTDFIIDLIFELIGEGAAEAIKSSKIPKIIRIVILSILCLPIIAICGFGARTAYHSTGVPGLCIVCLIGLFILALWIFGIVKIIRK